MGGRERKKIEEFVEEDVEKLLPKERKFNQFGIVFYENVLICCGLWICAWSRGGSL